MIERVEEYLSGKESYLSIANANGISDRMLRLWVAKYQAHGASVFSAAAGNRN